MPEKVEAKENDAAWREERLVSAAGLRRSAPGW